MFLAKHKVTNLYYAIKRISKTEVCRRKNIKGVLAEIDTLRACKHPFIVHMCVARCHPQDGPAPACRQQGLTSRPFHSVPLSQHCRHACVQDDKFIYIVLDYAVGGELYTRMGQPFGEGAS